ncbi:MAG: 3-isopropylmalate dehydrogenase [Bryobacterales bacterium]|nr:3-isopropylmalate dehydrogenase [Bryobacterales bacterium]MBV9400057.1 3-isopropylmalate dehydrogenase [Bryobacterales bacterium]
MNLKILLLPGDGIGVEVTNAAADVLKAVAKTFGHTLDLSEGLLGGIAIHKTGVPLPEETKNLAMQADATLMGAVGLPEFDTAPPSQRPEAGLLGLRKALDVFANLRPVVTYPELIESSPLKNHVVSGTDMIIVRELTGGLYYGQPRGIGNNRGFNTMSYTRAEVERVTHMAFKLARNRRKKVTSVDKSNVLEVSQFWRQVVSEIGPQYPDVQLEHMLVDNAAMQMVLRPTQFDVMLTENTFGDILSDIGGILAGSIGMLPSASLGATKGLYEPVHGSAPDIAGQNKANPLGAIGSVAAMLEYTFGLVKEAQALNAAIGKVLASGRVTADLRPKGTPATTQEVGEAVGQALALTRVEAI